MPGPWRWTPSRPTSGRCAGRPAPCSGRHGPVLPGVSALGAHRRPVSYQSGPRIMELSRGQTPGRPGPSRREFPVQPGRPTSRHFEIGRHQQDRLWRRPQGQRQPGRRQPGDLGRGHPSGGKSAAAPCGRQADFRPERPACAGRERRGRGQLCSTWTPAGRCRPGRSRKETGKHSP